MMDKIWREIRLKLNKLTNLRSGPKDFPNLIQNIDQNPLHTDYFSSNDFEK
jgi:hypothetical protein